MDEAATVQLPLQPPVYQVPPGHAAPQAATASPQPNPHGQPGPAVIGPAVIGPAVIGPAAFGPLPSGPLAGRRWWRGGRALLAGGIAAGLLLVVGVTAAYAYAGEVPRGTTVLGVDLGGKSQVRGRRGTARRPGRARRRAGRAGAGAVVAEKTVEITPADVGLAVDVDATVAAAAQPPPGPVRPALRLAGTVDPVIARRRRPARRDAA